MQGGEPASRGFRRGAVLALTMLAALTGCTILPNEFNLSPIYRQRLADDGTVLELDVAWPFVHYERTPDGGADFRIRPFYRYLTEPEDAPLTSPIDGPPDVGLAATEHQFLWPLGRVRSDSEQDFLRLWPFWSYTARTDEAGRQETDWYALFPFFWGGSREDGEENYFGLFPLYGDFPSFFVYERFQFFLFPLYLHLEKQGRDTHMFAWPFLGFSNGPTGFWHRVWPLYSYLSEEEYWRFYFLYPFVHWGEERLDSDDPVSRFWLWPLVGHQSSDEVSGWTVLWPFFQYVSIRERLTKLDLFWPIFRFQEDKSETSPLWQWWVWPLVSRVIEDDFRAWGFLWPLIWFREYDDPVGMLYQKWILPIYWSMHRERDEGGVDDFTQIWPLWHHQLDHNQKGAWSFPSVWPRRAGNAYGVREAYDWIWTIVQGRQRAADDTSVDAIAHVYTARQRGEKFQSSVPLLFNYESDEEGGVLRLFQFIPIPFGSGSSDAEDRSGS